MTSTTHEPKTPLFTAKGIALFAWLPLLAAAAVNLWGYDSWKSFVVPLWVAGLTLQALSFIMRTLNKNSSGQRAEATERALA